MPNDGLIIECMDLSHINLVVLNFGTYLGHFDPFSYLIGHLDCSLVNSFMCAKVLVA